MRFNGLYSELSGGEILSQMLKKAAVWKILGEGNKTKQDPSGGKILTLGNSVRNTNFWGRAAGCLRKSNSHMSRRFLLSAMVNFLLLELGRTFFVGN